MPYGLYLLTWDQLERARGPLDVEPIRAELASIIVEHGDPSLPDYPFSERISRVLVEHCGAWALGWCWRVEDGGLVTLPHPSPNRLARTVDPILAALREWHAIIETLAREFEALAPADDAPIAEVVEFAAAVLVDWVLARTEANDAWYGSFVSVLGWYLQAWALADETAEAEVLRVVSGKFESGMVPSPVTIATTCAALGTAVGQRPESRDATLAWIETRRRAFGGAFGLTLESAGHPRNDGHLRFIEGVERRRDPVRADRMHAALGSCRAAALAGESLDLPMLARWNATLLGQPSSVTRETEAYAKAGRERYGTAVGDETWIAYISEANELESPRALRAARVYLDVCFFHPFADGNARTARLALDFVLARERFGLYLAEPVFTLARAANDIVGTRHFAWLIERLTVRLP